MTRLIDADKLHDLFDKNCVGDCNVCNFYTSVHYVIHNKDCKGHSYCGLIDNAPTVDTDLSKYSDKLWKEAYERGHKEGYKQAIRDGKTNFSRPKGKWIQDIHSDTICSKCGFECAYNEEGLYSLGRFCHHCGADMRGDKSRYEGGRQ